jgi:hypothetical protein
MLRAHSSSCPSIHAPRRRPRPAGTFCEPWIEAMNLHDFPRHPAGLEQVFLLDRDAGLLCRILGLYAARGLDVLHIDYAYAARDVMKLRVSVAADAADGTQDRVRVLVEKAATLVGVLAACEQEAEQRRAA